MTMTVRNPWPRLYRARHDYVWGTAPTGFAQEVAVLRRGRQCVLDVGCGEGRDVVFFAGLGYQTVGLDISRAGITKARRLAKAAGVRARWIVAEIERYRPRVEAEYDIVFSCGVLHYLPRAIRSQVFGRLKAATRPGGLHAVMVFTDSQPHQELGERIEVFGDGELSAFYDDWVMIRYREETIACRADGTPHEHSVAAVIVERPWQN